LEYEFIDRFYLKTLDTVFLRFTYMPDFFDFVKETIYYYFPDFRTELDFSRYSEVERVLLKLLFLEGNITVEMLNNMKAAYLKLYQL